MNWRTAAVVWAAVTWGAYLDAVLTVGADVVHRHLGDLVAAVRAPVLVALLVVGTLTFGIVLVGVVFGLLLVLVVDVLPRVWRAWRA